MVPRPAWLRTWAVAVATATLLSACGGPLAPGPDTSGPEDLVGAPLRVLRVVDGDTFHVLVDGRDITIRLIGIDTPEVGWYGGDAECYGTAAGRFVRRLLRGQRVRLEYDAERIDPYGRTLAYAHLQGGSMLNLLLVRRGFAEVTIYEPNHRYAAELRAAEEAARSAGRGLWSARWRPMIIRWTWLVPSTIWRPLASRMNRSTGYSAMYP